MGTSPYPQYHNNIPYSTDSPLNTLDVCLPRPPDRNKDSKRLWLIYIHGGAWRDPTISSTSFSPTLTNLLENKPTADHIAGYASLNYRLSPHPSHPTHPSNPSDPSRNAKHPDHINDILAAILHLQTEYRFAEKYILVGHSCGATLAFQLCMRRFWGQQYESSFALELNVEPPIAVVALAGLYDLNSLVKAHEGEGYREFVAAAFGESGLDGERWERVSPACWGDFESSWGEGRLVLLGFSMEDGLVEEGQVVGMERCLQGQGWSAEVGAERRVRRVGLEGVHDEVWKSGKAALVLEEAVEEVVGML